MTFKKWPVLCLGLKLTINVNKSQIHLVGQLTVVKIPGVFQNLLDMENTSIIFGSSFTDDQVRSPSGT
jgi:hypothetical protein